MTDDGDDRSGHRREREGLPRRVPWWSPLGWLPEKHRGMASAACAIVGGPTIVWTTRAAHAPAEALARITGSTALIFTIYLVVYVALTTWSFARTKPEDCLAWARATRRGNPFQRWVYATDPGAGTSTLVAFVALGAALTGNIAQVWGRHLQHPLELAATVLLIVLAWVSVLLTYSIDYLCRDQRDSGTHLSFPGGVERWSDYLYFSMAVMTTFGATDVTVETSSMRRNVTVHAAIAFVFNTVILALVIGLFP
ncbi:DUF1345 domain-containing protein [Mobilicoccus massiliensis]|uniref:DUF1345 domain-containing protein n=1 Tax=Mobilicoccus massiliensis TaxID=1522310 RepID=UPI000693BCE0|nr:DUF1345 domain-containing protein [Mobilicoccus massiliensis]